MSTEYILEPLNPLEISFSKDKCNVSGTPRPVKQEVLPTTNTNSKDSTPISKHQEQVYVRPFSSNYQPALLPFDLPAMRRTCVWTIDRPVRKIEMSSPKRRLVATAYPRSSGSTARKSQLNQPHPSTVRRALDFDLRVHHENEIDHLDEMLKRINLQLESSARCLERFTAKKK